MSKQLFLNIFLIKKDFTDKSLFLRNNESLKQYNIPNIGYLYTKPSRSNDPAWLNLFEHYIQREVLIFSASARALLVVKIEDRTFALAFGQGRHLLVPGTWEERF